MSGDGRCRRLSLPAPAPPLEDDNLLAEILLRLPPRPSSLPRAAAVCKRWCRLVSDRHFLSRFRDHHRTPPLLGFFHGGTFVPTQEPPDRVPAARFSFNPDGAWKSSSRVCLTGCRGLVLAWNNEEFLVIDTMAGLWCRIPSPAKHTRSWPWAAVVPPACGSNGRSLFRFRLIALFADESSTVFARVYSSESGAWEHSVALSDSESSCLLITHRPGGSIVGNAVYWMFLGTEKAILEFDLDRQSLSVIQIPPDANVGNFGLSCQIMPAESGRLGLVILAGCSMQFWERETNHGHPAGWVLHRTVQSNNFLHQGCSMPAIVGFSEERHAIFVHTEYSVFMVQLKTMEYKKVLDNVKISNIVPYSSFWEVSRVGRWLPRCRNGLPVQILPFVCCKL